MDLGRFMRFGNERLTPTGGQRHIDTAERHHRQCIARRVLKRRIAMDGRDADQIKMPRGEEERDGIIMARVAIDQHFRFHGTSNLR